MIDIPIFKSMIMKHSIPIVFALFISLGNTVPKSQADSESLLAELDRNFFSLDMEFVMEMKILKKGKVRRTYEMQVVKKDQKMRLDILHPSIERDRRILNDGENLWMYLPRSSKLIKLPSKQAFLGGDASNRDILRISLVEDYNLVGNLEEIGGQLLLRLKAKDLKTSYNQVNFYVDKKTKFPIKQEMLSLSGKVIKTIEYDKFVALEESQFPTEVTILDELKKDSKTIFTYSDMTRGTDKSAVYFTTASLSK